MLSESCSLASFSRAVAWLALLAYVVELLTLNAAEEDVHLRKDLRAPPC